MSDSKKEQKEDRATKAAAEREARDARKVKKASVSMESKIKILVKENPRRSGSVPHAHFETYKDGTTVGAFLEGGGNWLHLSADIERGYIGLEA